LSETGDDWKWVSPPGEWAKLQLTNDPRFGESDLEEDDFLDGAVILDDTLAGGEESPTDDPSTGGEEQT